MREASPLVAAAAVAASASPARPAPPAAAASNVSSSPQGASASQGAMKRASDYFNFPGPIEEARYDTFTVFSWRQPTELRRAASEEPMAAVDPTRSPRSGGNNTRPAQPPPWSATSMPWFTPKKYLVEYRSAYSTHTHALETTACHVVIPHELFDDVLILRVSFRVPMYDAHGVPFDNRLPLVHLRGEQMQTDTHRFVLRRPPPCPLFRAVSCSAGAHVAHRAIVLPTAKRVVPDVVVLAALGLAIDVRTTRRPDQPWVPDLQPLFPAWRPIGVQHPVVFSAFGAAHIAVVDVNMSMAKKDPLSETPSAQFQSTEQQQLLLFSRWLIVVVAPRVDISSNAATTGHTAATLPPAASYSQESIPFAQIAPQVSNHLSAWLEYPDRAVMVTGYGNLASHKAIRLAASFTGQLVSVGSGSTGGVATGYSKASRVFCTTFEGTMPRLYNFRAPSYDIARLSDRLVSFCPSAQSHVSPTDDRVGAAHEFAAPSSLNDGGKRRHPSWLTYLDVPLGALCIFACDVSTGQHSCRVETGHVCTALVRQGAIGFDPPAAPSQNPTFVDHLSYPMAPSLLAETLATVHSVPVCDAIESFCRPVCSSVVCTFIANRGCVELAVHGSNLRFPNILRLYAPAVSKGTDAAASNEQPSAPSQRPFVLAEINRETSSSDLLVARASLASLLAFGTSLALRAATGVCEAELRFKLVLVTSLGSVVFPDGVIALPRSFALFSFRMPSVVAPVASSVDAEHHEAAPPPSGHHHPHAAARSLATHPPATIVESIITLEAVLVSPTNMQAEASSRLLRAIETAAAIRESTELQITVAQKSAAGIFSRVVRAVTSELLTVKHLIVPVEPPHSDVVDTAVVGFMPQSHSSNPRDLFSVLQPSVTKWFAQLPWLKSLEAYRAMLCRLFLAIGAAPLPEQLGVTYTDAAAEALLYHIMVARFLAMNATSTPSGASAAVNAATASQRSLSPTRFGSQASLSASPGGPRGSGAVAVAPPSQQFVFDEVAGSSFITVMSRVLLQCPKYASAKANDAPQVFEDALGLWTVALIFSARALLSQLSVVGILNDHTLAAPNPHGYRVMSNAVSDRASAALQGIVTDVLRSMTRAGPNPNTPTTSPTPSTTVSVSASIVSGAVVRTFPTNYDHFYAVHANIVPRGVMWLVIVGGPTVSAGGGGREHSAAVPERVSQLLDNAMDYAESFGDCRAHISILVDGFELFVDAPPDVMESGALDTPIDRSSATAQSADSEPLPPSAKGPQPHGSSAIHEGHKEDRTLQRARQYVARWEACNPWIVKVRQVIQDAALDGFLRVEAFSSVALYEYWDGLQRQSVTPSTSSVELSPTTEIPHVGRWALEVLKTSLFRLE